MQQVGLESEYNKRLEEKAQVENQKYNSLKLLIDSALAKNAHFLNIRHPWNLNDQIIFSKGVKLVNFIILFFKFLFSFFFFKKVVILVK